MKKIALLLCFILLLASCGQTNEPVVIEEDIDTSVALNESAETTADGTQTAETPMAETPMDEATASETQPDASQANEAETASGPSEPVTIKWGWGHLVGAIGQQIDLSAASIPAYIGEKYGVNIEMLQMGTEHIMNPSTVEADIYFQNAPSAWSNGVTRSIPREMIDKYAPRYAQLLDTKPYIADMHKVPGEDAYQGLLMYNGESNMLQTYSVYRLDWLEAAGIVPNGTPEEIFDRVYFTDQAFTQAQFVKAMTAFTNLDSDPQTHGFVLPQEVSILSEIVSPLAGMWGLNMVSWFESGSAISGEGYKEFLRFLNYLYEAELVEFLPFTNPDDPTNSDAAVSAMVMAPLEGRVGWWTEQLQSLGYYHAGDGRSAVLGMDADAKLLIAPPEAGSYGSQSQGVGISTVLPVFFNDIYHWVINKDVSDEKLAEILTLFDGLSFDQDSWVTAMYGFEGEDFEWDGEPYNSGVNQTSQQYIAAFMEKGTLSLHTNIFDGIAGRSIYSLGDNALTRFAISGAASRMVILPSNEDIAGEFTDEFTALQTQYFTGLNDAAQRFYYGAVTGEIDIDAEWDAYLAELDANGMREFTALTKKFPAVGLAG